MINIKTVKVFLLFFLLSPVHSPAASAAGMQVLGQWDNGITWDVVAKDNYLYLAAGEQVRIYDISTKNKLLNVWKQTNVWAAEPALGTYKENLPPVAILHAKSFVEGLFVNGNYLFVASKNQFLIANISDPKNSTIISSCPVGGRDVVVNGSYAFIASADRNTGIKIIDVSNKNNPVLVKTLALAGNNAPWRIDISGNYLYAAMEGDRRMDIVNVANPLNPVVVGSFTNNTSAGLDYSGVAVRGNYAYIVEYHNGLRIVDVSNPVNPVEVNRIVGAPNEYNYADVKLLGNYAFVSVRYGGIDIIDISNPTAASIISHGIDPAGPYAEGIFPVSLSYGNYAFMAGDSEGLAIFDVNNVTNPNLVSRVWINGV